MHLVLTAHGSELHPEHGLMLRDPLIIQCIANTV